MNCGRKRSAKRSVCAPYSPHTSHYTPCPLTPPARDYLLRRGLTEAEIISLGVTGLQEYPPYAFFPVAEGIYHGRRICEGFPRYRTVGPWRGELWNEHSVVPGRPVVVCEGIFDAIYFWPQGVALLGHALRRRQALKLLDRRPSRVILACDDDAALLHAREVVRGLDRTIPVELWPPPLGCKDWGDMLPQGRHTWTS
jgi:hypothetical protein